MTRLLDPDDIHAPVGGDSHTAAVPAGAELIFASGQVAVRPDGSIPPALAEQAEVVFQNLRACLAAHRAGMQSVVKLTCYIVSGQDVELMRGARQRHFGTHRPASTAVFVPALVNPAFLLEVEAVAVKAN